MKCFVCGIFFQTFARKDKIMDNSFRQNIKSFCSKMYEDFVKAEEPNVCVNCHKIVQQASNFKKMVINSGKIMTKTWFEYDCNKIDLPEIFGNYTADENELHHVYDIKDESLSQIEPPKDSQNSSEGSLDKNVMDLEAIFCVNDPDTMARVQYYKEQEQAEQKAIEDRENVPKTPKKQPAARRRQSISSSKAKSKTLNTQKRWMICSLCNDVLVDAQILRQHIIIHAK